MFKTRITEKLGVRYPIIQGSMLYLSLAELVSEVSNAGALGMLNSVCLTSKKALRDEIRKTKNLTANPFAVQLVYLPASREIPNDQFIETIIEERVKIIETVGPVQPAVISRLHQAGITCLHKATTVRHALAAERAGADAVTVEGLECAGHAGMSDVTSLILIQRTIQEVKIPVIAAGGFVDGKGLVAALAMGAEAILMGTRFFLTRECPIHPNIKEFCVNAREIDTAVCLRSLRDPVRYLRTDVVDKILEMEASGADLKQLLTVVSGENMRQAVEQGDLTKGPISVGQCVGLIHDIPTVKELIDRIMNEAEEARRRLNIIQ
ncbi:MAG: nitronate monooxygenase [Dehalococcoidia bacterium]|nr:nitronate monooxygenase [Dehalococcoidia bacterium]